MYWNNPITEFTYPSEHDPIDHSLHNGAHCLFYDPAVSKHSIRTNQRLQDLCNWANTEIASDGLRAFLSKQNNHYDIANLVKLNLWVHDLPRRGSIKPMLLQYIGNSQYESGTGESRLRALERIPQIQQVSAFISTHQQHAGRFSHLESVKTYARFAELCRAEPGQKFLFRFTDADAPYGLDWYEYNSSSTAEVTPGTEYCVDVLSNYLAHHPGTNFTPSWFDKEIVWATYKSS